MIPGIYSSASALDAALLNHDVVAHNLAHADMPGYRRQFVSFESFEQYLPYPSLDDTSLLGLGTGTLGVHVAFESGPIQFTGNDLDLAIAGDAFFVVDGPDGPLYTRNGVFTLNALGQLLSSANLPVRGIVGAIVVPPGTSQITVTENGTVLADGVGIDQLELVQFANPEVLQLAGTTLFHAPLGAGPQPSTGTIHQGYREMSNVQVLDELVSMIAGFRYYEAAQRALTTLDEAIEENTSATV